MMYRQIQRDLDCRQASPVQAAYNSKKKKKKEISLKKQKLKQSRNTEKKKTTEPSGSVR